LPADGFGDGEDVWALMQINMLPKQEIMTATNNFFISVIRLVMDQAPQEPGLRRHHACRNK
jgi:hypothetical protein